MNFIFKKTILWKPAGFSVSFDDFALRGVPFCISESSIVKYGIDILFAENAELKQEKILLYDDDQLRLNMFSEMCSLFGVLPVKVTNFSDLYDLDHDSVSMIIARIDMTGADVNTYVKRAACSKLKFIPFIPFRADDTAVNISDFLSGLGKVARVVMNFKEAACFIAGMLTKIDISNSAMLYGKLQKSECVMNYTGKSIRNIYHENPDDLFNAVSDKNISGDMLFDMMERNRKSLIRLELISQLLNISGKNSICG